MNPNDIIQNFRQALSPVREQIEQILEANQEKAVPVISLDFPNLPKVFPSDLLDKAKVVTAFGPLPFSTLPPALRRTGLPDFEQMANVSEEGVT